MPTMKASMGDGWSRPCWVVSSVVTRTISPTPAPMLSPRHDGILFGAEHRLHQQELIAYKLRHFAGGDNGPLDDP